MTKLIHITDTHLVEPGRLLYGLDPQARLAAAVDDINRNHADAALVVITGDLTHWGEGVAYEALREVLDDLIPPCIPLLGNHDDRPTFRGVFPNAPVDENGFIQGRHDVAEGRLLFLDTNQPGTHAGWYCEQRQDWLRHQLAAAGDRPLFVFMHHPPFEIGIGPMDRIGLIQREQVAALMRPYRQNLRHVFFGHVHRPIVGSWMGVPFSTMRATNHQVWLDFRAEQLAAVPGSHEPPAYAVVCLRGEDVVIHFHDYLDDSRKFPLGGQTQDEREYAYTFEPAE